MNIPLVVLEFANYGPTLGELANEVERVPRYQVVVKKTDGGFYYASVDLNDLLGGWGVSNLVLMGIEASLCVLTTAKAAVNRYGYHVITGGNLVADVAESCCFGRCQMNPESLAWYQANGRFHEVFPGLSEVLDFTT